VLSRLELLEIVDVRAEEGIVELGCGPFSFSVSGRSPEVAASEVGSDVEIPLEFFEFRNCFNCFDVLSEKQDVVHFELPEVDVGCLSS
jgi:hypothetical protein